METIEDFMKRLKPLADSLGVYLKPPLRETKILKTAKAIHKELGLIIPDDYLRLLRITNGIETQRGYLSSLDDIAEQNATLWFMRTETRSNADGDFEIRYEPLDDSPTPEYIWLGYQGNQAEQIFDLATKEFHRRGLGCDTPDNDDRSLVGMLNSMIDFNRRYR